MTVRPVVFRPLAVDDLDQLHPCIAGQAGRATATADLDRLEQACLARGTRRDDLGEGVRLVGFERRVIITFEVAAGEVVILRVFCGGRDVEALLGDRLPLS